MLSHKKTNRAAMRELNLQIDGTPTDTVVRCSGTITSNTTALLRAGVKPLLTEKKTVILDLSAVSYMDSSGLGTMVGLFVSAKVAKCQLKVIKLNERVKELFSLTRLGEVLGSEGREPGDFGIA
jgi:anti-sigma B factor antagonist